MKCFLAKKSGHRDEKLNTADESPAYVIAEACMGVSKTNVCMTTAIVFRL